MYLKLAVSRPTEFDLNFFAVCSRLTLPNLCAFQRLSFFLD